MSVVWMVAGGVTDSGITCATKVTNGPVRVAVDTDPEFGAPTFFGPVAVDAQGVAKVPVTGLDPATRYFWQVEDDGLMETPAVRLPGASGDHATTPDSDPLNITGDLDIRIDFVPDDLSSNQYVAAKYTSSAGLRAYAVRVIPGALLNFLGSEDGDVSFNVSSTVPVPQSEGTRFCARWTFVGDNGDGEHQVAFYTAATMAGPWTQLGDVVTTAGTRTLHESGAALSVGAQSNGSSPLVGRVFSAEVRDGVEGVIVAHPRFDEQEVGSTTFMDAHDNGWVLNGNAEITGGHAGTFRTLPEPNGPISFSFAAATCAGNSGSTGSPVGDVLRPTRISNHEVFSLLGARAIDEDWAFFHHGGDLHYYDLGGSATPPASLTNLRRAVDDVFTQPHQAHLMRSVPWSYMDDDHDWVGGNNNDGTHPARDDAIQVWRETWPTPPLGDSDPTAARYYSFQVGRVLFMVADVRADRDPNDTPQGPTKTMLGADQKTWMAAELAGTDAVFVVWLMGDQWQRNTSGGAGDHWGSFVDERAEVAGIFADAGFAGRAMVIQGDAHSNAVATQHHPNVHGIPAVQCAALDATPTGDALAEQFDGPFFNDRNQYGVFHVNDLGEQIIVTAELYSMSTLQTTWSFATPPPPPPSQIFLTQTVAGSHRALFEARVLTDFQTSADPDGVGIPIHDGDVQFDATADVLATLSLTTDGHDGRRSLLPRRATDLLAPYGNEVWVRRGVDFGDQQVWWPLGFFRIDTAEQGPSSGHPIRLSGSDRMAGIVHARLVAPVQFSEDDTVGLAVSTLVHDVYPAAVILFDDGSASQRLGRQIIVEEDRYAALLDVVESLGKVAYWTGEGALSIADEPDPDDIVWDLKAGTHGVLAEASRQVTRDGMRNGWVVTGEGAGEQPIRAFVADVGPNSPTRWGGRFGRVPGFYHSPLITTSAQARRAAEQKLRRHLGMPYSVSFGSVPNPALRPRQAVRITQRDGSRERHIVETLTVPLSADARMSGTTREQTLIDVRSL